MSQLITYTYRCACAHVQRLAGNNLSDTVTEDVHSSYKVARPDPSQAVPLSAAGSSGTKQRDVGA